MVAVQALVAPALASYQAHQADDVGLLELRVAFPQVVPDACLAAAYAVDGPLAQNFP